MEDKSLVACLFCRARRIRCNGPAPCLACSQRGKVCVFPAEPPRKRGPKLLRGGGGGGGGEDEGEGEAWGGSGAGGKRRAWWAAGAGGDGEGAPPSATRARASGWGAGEAEDRAFWAGATDADWAAFCGGPCPPPPCTDAPVPTAADWEALQAAFSYPDPHLAVLLDQRACMEVRGAVRAQKRRARRRLSPLPARPPFLARPRCSKRGPRRAWAQSRGRCAPLAA